MTKARGKSGPLFHFDVHEDIRMVNDVRIEKDESHPGILMICCSLDRDDMCARSAVFPLKWLCLISLRLAGKVVERRWYERNKHIFPASRWETYDPAVSREGERYTIHGGEVNADDARP